MNDPLGRQRRTSFAQVPDVVDRPVRDASS